MKATRTREAIVLRVPLQMKAVGQAKGDTKRREVFQKESPIHQRVTQTYAYPDRQIFPLRNTNMN